MKKIFFLIPSLTSGGSERVFSILANHLDPEMWAITVVVLDGRQPFYTINTDKVRVVDLQSPRVRQSFVKIFKFIRNEKPHLVVSTLSHLNQFIALIKPFLPRETRFIARESTILTIFHQQESLPALRNFLVRWLYPSFDALICQSQRMANGFKNNYKIPSSKLHIINNPVDTEGVKLRGLKRSGNFQSSPNVSPNVPANVPPKKAAYRFVSVGRLSTEKGIDKALRILAELGNLDFEYYLIGDGKERGRLEALAQTLGISENVVFQGVQKNPFAWIASANFLLLTSDFEGFPNVLLEAGAVGTPSIAFSCGGVVAEIIELGINGFFVPDGDEAAFRAAILRGIKTPFDRLCIQDLTKEKFGVEKIVAQYSATFLRVIDVEK
ncbi:MAG: glycosyltransferase [Saprospiraceae bacterium]|nr:glycosyltransferase [Saprospiraceae bacterium]